MLLLLEFLWQHCGKSWNLRKMGDNISRRILALDIVCLELRKINSKHVVGVISLYSICIFIMVFPNNIASIRIDNTSATGCAHFCINTIWNHINQNFIEPFLTKDEAPYCGGCAKSIETRKQMAFNRCESLPLDDVVLYCTGCVRSFSETKAIPHHLLDLIYNEPTEGLTIKI